MFRFTGTRSFSLLDGIAKPEAIARRLEAIGSPACAITDHGSVSGVVAFSKALRKRGIRPILGMEAYICREDPAKEEGNRELRKANGRPYDHCVVLCKNLPGWQKLVRLVSLSYSPSHFYYHPRLPLEAFRDAQGDLIAMSGHPGSGLANVIFEKPKDAYNCRSLSLLRSDHIHPQARERLDDLTDRYVSVFGRENFFIEVQDLDPEGFPAGHLVAKVMRDQAKRKGLKCIATADSHYVEKRDAFDQQVLLCSKLKTTLKSVQDRIAEDQDVELGGFFRREVFHIPSYEEMRGVHREMDLAMTHEVAAMIEDYDILNPPRMPSFACPEGHTSDSYLRYLAEEGLRRKGIDESRGDYALYRDRLNMEMEVFRKVGISAYFLIIADLCRFAKDNGWLMSPGRGSGAGCLTSWVTRITEIDPLPYDLLFERFFNEGRFQEGHFSLPDIDLDFPGAKRHLIFRRCQDRFGVDRVAKIGTFSSLQGRSALDAVMRARGIDFDEIKQITSVIPDKARISEELQAMADAGEEPSVIGFALDVYGKELSEWVQQRDDGSLEGVYSAEFAQARRLEGVKSHRGKHAAGIVIADRPLADLCPLRYDQGDNSYIADMEYPDLEAMGLMKIDCLGVFMLDKLEGVREIALTGEITGDLSHADGSSPD